MTKSRDLGNLAQTVAINLPTSIGTAGQVVQVNTGENGLQFADAGGGVTTYAQISDMTGSGAAVGSMGWVTANQSIYVKNTSGWYKIALANSTPTITSPSSGSITLATDGTATIVSIVGADADEGVTLQFSYQVTTGSLTNGGGASATVTSSATSGGTYTALAASTNTTNSHFKITPTTTEAYAGSFSITFNCTDQINTANIVKSFTLQFDPLAGAEAKFNWGEYTNRGSGGGFTHIVADYSANGGKVGNKCMDTGNSGRGSTYWDLGTTGGSTYSIGMWAKATHTAPSALTHRYIWSSATTQWGTEKQGLRWDESNNRFELYENSSVSYWTNFAQSAGNSSYGWPSFSAFTVGSNPNNQWLHLTVTASPTNGTKFYVNGTRHGWNTNSSPMPVGRGIVIGDYYDSFNRSSVYNKNLYGLIDQFFYISSELSASEVASVYALTTEWS